MATGLLPMHTLPDSLKKYLLTTSDGYVRTGTLLGKGSFGIVVKYVNNMPDAPFKTAAGKHLKISPIAALSSAQADQLRQAIESFLIELSALCTITKTDDCPYITKFIGYYDSPELVIFTEFFKNQSLADEMIRNGAALSAERSLKYFYQIAKGLEFLHHLKPERIIHRDLKCENILLSDDLKCIKLADFGLAFTLAVDSHSMTLSEEAPRETCGTFPFLAPEVLLAKKYGRRSDVWALSCTLVQMLTKLPPHVLSIRSAEELVQKARSSKSNQLPYDGNRFLPQALRGSEMSLLLDCMFIKNPAQRPMIDEVLAVLAVVSQVPLEIKIDATKVAALKAKIGTDKGISKNMFDKIAEWIICH